MQSVYVLGYHSRKLSLRLQLCKTQVSPVWLHITDYQLVPVEFVEFIGIFPEKASQLLHGF